MGITNKDPYREKAEVPFYADNLPYRTPASPDPEPKKPLLSREAKSSLLAILAMIIVPLLVCVIGYGIGRIFYLVSRHTLPSDISKIIFCGFGMGLLGVAIPLLLYLIFTFIYIIIDDYLNEKR
jgi:hypothetical protein